MMSDEALVPPPPVIRERLAESLEETRLLRRLLRLSERFADRRHRRQRQDAHHDLDPNDAGPQRGKGDR